MSVATLLLAVPERPFRFREGRPAEISDAVYRDLVETVFTMRVPIIGLGTLYALVGYLIYSVWPDPLIGALTACAIVITATRAWLISAYFRSGGSSQAIQALRLWERRYARATYIFALLLAGLTVRSLTVQQPLFHMATISLIFTFGAGVVSRTAGRPVICGTSIVLAVAPTVAALTFHALEAGNTGIEAKFFALEAALLAIIGAMSLVSARHLYRSSVAHLTTKHDLGLLARSDPLTGLPNRLLMREAFQLAVKQSAATGRQLAVHYLDLDGFKAVNDGHGHPVGDKLLREVAARLNDTVRVGDTVSRLGGDEFLLIQVGLEHRGEAEMLGRRIVRKLSAPYIVDGRELRISVSIGIAMSPEYGTELEHLIACADTALYRSKAGGKAQINFCTTDCEGISTQAAA